MSELRKKMKCTLKSDDTNMKIKKDPVEEYLLVQQAKTLNKLL